MSVLAFLFAAVVLAVTPGPGIADIVARTVAGGRKEGLASCIGTGIGGMLHVLAAAPGLSLIVVQSAWAFNVIKHLGATRPLNSGVARAARARALTRVSGATMLGLCPHLALSRRAA